MEAEERRCVECGHAPRRMSMEMDGLLFCQRDCYISYSGRKWDRAFTDKFCNKPKANVLELRKEFKSA